MTGLALIVLLSGAVSVLQAQIDPDDLRPDEGTISVGGISLDAPETRVLDAGQVLRESHHQDLRNRIAEREALFPLNFYVVIGFSEGRRDQQRQADYRVHLWLSDEYGVVIFYDVRGVHPPAIGYSQELTLRVSEADKAELRRLVTTAWLDEEESSGKIHRSAMIVINSKAIENAVPISVRVETPSVPGVGVSSEDIIERAPKIEGVVSTQTHFDEALIAEDEGQSRVFLWIMVANGILGALVIVGAIFLWLRYMRESRFTDSTRGRAARELSGANMSIYEGPLYQARGEGEEDEGPMEDVRGSIPLVKRMRQRRADLGPEAEELNEQPFLPQRIARAGQRRRPRPEDQDPY